MSKNVGSIGVKLSTGLSKKMPARVRDIARARQTRNTTRDLRGPRRTSDVFLDKAVDCQVKPFDVMQSDWHCNASKNCGNFAVIKPDN